MQHVKALFDSEAEAKEFMASYLSRYHPAGYGTSLTIGQTVTGQWFVKGSRGSTCD